MAAKRPSWVKLRERGLRWRVVPDAATDFAETHRPLLEALEGSRTSCEILRDSPRKKVWRQRLAGGVPTHAYLKSHVQVELRSCFEAAPAAREARALRCMQELGVPAPRLVGWGVARRLPRTRISALVSATEDRFDHFGRQAHRALVVERTAPEDFAPVLGTLLEVVRRMHDASLFHRDLNLGNVLFDPIAIEFGFIDFHRAAFGRFGTMWWRTEDLTKLYQIFDDYFAWPEWLALLEAHYLRGDSDLRRGTLGCWEEVVRRRNEGKVAGAVKDALRGRHRFARQRGPHATVRYLREAGRRPDELIRLARTGGTGPVRVLGDFQHAKQAERAWAEAVREAARRRPKVAPVALVDLREAGSKRSVLLGDETLEPSYTVARLFSLERFAADASAGKR